MKSMRKWIRLVIISLSVFIVAVVLTAGLLIWDGMTDHVVKSDVAVVLGYAVKNDRQPSPRLQSRLDKALNLYKRGFFSTIIVSGGTGKHGYDEARDMKRYLVKKGIPPEHIYEDKAGKNTYMTARNASRVMTERGLKSAMVITQYYHIPRSKLAFRRFGISPVYSAHVDSADIRDLYSTVREVIAYYAYVLRSYRTDEIKSGEI